MLTRASLVNTHSKNLSSIRSVTVSAISIASRFVSDLKSRRTLSSSTSLAASTKPKTIADPVLSAAFGDFAARSSKLSYDKNTIGEWLAGARDISDIQYFLSNFGPTESTSSSSTTSSTAQKSPKIAVIKIGGAIVEEEMHVLAPSISLLYRLGISPIVIHGGGPQLNKLLEGAGITPEYIDGMRVTDPDTLKIAERVFNEANKTTVAGLQAAGIPAVPCTYGILYADILDYSKWKLVGKTTGVNKKLLMDCVHSGVVPVISSLAQDKTGQTLNINADIAACEVSRGVLPFSTVFLNSTGGIPGQNGQIIETINLHKEYDHLLSQSWVKYGTRLKIKEFKELLDSLPNDSSVTITSTDHLTRSLLFGRCSMGTTVTLGGPSKAFSAGGATRGFSTYSSSSSSTSSSSKKLGVGIVGARGYVGRELIKLIQVHPGLELRCVGSRANAGSFLKEHVPEFTGSLKYEALPASDISKFSKDVDCWVLALPNGHCEPYVNAIKALGSSSVVTVDLSGDNRFTDEWQYGLPERFRSQISKAKFISNPGCYATGAQLSVLPLVKYLAPENPPAIFGVSGYSGAGTTPSEKNDPVYLKDNLVPYSLTGHLHEREVSRQVGTKVHFIPHVAPFFQGITLTTDIRLKKDAKLTREAVIELFKSMYGKEPLIDVVVDKMPVVKDNACQHFVRLGGFSVSSDGSRVVVIATLDNLLKGAATQALQNMNIALGLPEYDGIEIPKYKEAELKASVKN